MKPRSARTQWWQTTPATALYTCHTASLRTPQHALRPPRPPSRPYAHALMFLSRLLNLSWCFFLVLLCLGVSRLLLLFLRLSSPPYLPVFPLANVSVPFCSTTLPPLVVLLSLTLCIPALPPCHFLHSTLSLSLAPVFLSVPILSSVYRTPILLAFVSLPYATVSLLTFLCFVALVSLLYFCYLSISLALVSINALFYYFLAPNPLPYCLTTLCLLCALLTMFPSRGP